MKTKKLSLEKLQITKLNNLSFIRGGDDDTTVINTQSKVIENCLKDSETCQPTTGTQGEE